MIFFYNPKLNPYNDISKYFSGLEEFLNESSGRIIKRIVLSLESFSYQLIVLQTDQTEIFTVISGTVLTVIRISFIIRLLFSYFKKLVSIAMGMLRILRIQEPNFLIIAAILCAILQGIASLMYYILFKFLSRLFVVLQLQREASTIKNVFKVTS